MGYAFSSIFAEEMKSYIELVTGSGRYVEKIKSSLKSLDIYLSNGSASEKILTESLVGSWLNGKNTKPQTKARILDDIRGFAKYLVSVGYQVSLPEPQITHQDYVPYIFSSEEMARIFDAADNFQAHPNSSPADIQFPVVLRILYGCGLRLREALTMTWKGVDFDRGVLIIHTAKNQKQRLVPFSDSLKYVLAQYRRFMFSNGKDNNYVFESRHNPGNPYDNSTFWRWFSKILRDANIFFTRSSTHERGPCPHCMRHMFVVHSFMKSEAEDRDMENAVPFLSAYLGHEGILETQKYLRAGYILYTQSHQKINAYIGELFPEVSFG
jgi:integrase